MTEINNSRLDLYGAEHSKCDRAMTLGFISNFSEVLATTAENSRLIMFVCSNKFDNVMSLFKDLLTVSQACTCTDKQVSQNKLALRS